MPWACVACTFENVSAHIVCEMCFADRSPTLEAEAIPPQLPARQLWKRVESVPKTSESPPNVQLVKTEEVDKLCNVPSTLDLIQERSPLVVALDAGDEAAIIEALTQNPQDACTPIPSGLAFLPGASHNWSSELRQGDRVVFLDAAQARNSKVPFHLPCVVHGSFTPDTNGYSVRCVNGPNGCTLRGPNGELIDRHFAPSELAVPVEARWLPLHYAVAGLHGEDIIAAILRAHPEGAAHRDASGTLPLVLAAQIGANEWPCSTDRRTDMVKDMLFEAHPEATLGAALHEVLSWGAKAVKHTIAACSEATHTAIPRGLVCVPGDRCENLEQGDQVVIRDAGNARRHGVPHYGPPCTVVDVLGTQEHLKLINPSGEALRGNEYIRFAWSANKTDSDSQGWFKSGTVAKATEVGWLPLLYALHLGCREEVVAVLLQANDQAAQAMDATGNLALHIALTRTDQEVKDGKAGARWASPNTMQALIAAYPESAFTPDKDQNLPLDHFVALGCFQDADTMAGCVDGLKSCGFDLEFVLLFLAIRMRDDARYLEAAQKLVEIGATGCIDHGLNAGETARDVGLNSSDLRVRRFFRGLGTYLTRYNLHHGGHPTHHTDTCIVLEATDLEAKEEMKGQGKMRKRDESLALKVMHVEEQFRNEVIYRNRLKEGNQNCATAMVPVFCVHVPEAWYEGYRAEFADLVAPQPSEGENWVLVMPLADRTLNGIILDEHVAGRDLNTIKKYIQQICRCVDVLHQSALCHGDIKTRNIVREVVTRELVLIDLDAAAYFGDSIGHKAVTSSSKIPPEDAQRVRSDGEFLLAAPSYDMWMMGIVCYELLTGRELFCCQTKDSDVIDEVCWRELTEWEGLSEGQDSQVLAHCNEAPICKQLQAVDLLHCLLARDPAERPDSVVEVLAHPFFQEDQLGGLIHEPEATRRAALGFALSVLSMHMRDFCEVLVQQFINCCHEKVSSGSSWRAAVDALKAPNRRAKWESINQNALRKTCSVCKASVGGAPKVQDEVLVTIGKSTVVATVTMRNPPHQQEKLESQRKRVALMSDGEARNKEKKQLTKLEDAARRNAHAIPDKDKVSYYVAVEYIHPYKNVVVETIEKVQLLSAKADPVESDQAQAQVSKLKEMVNTLGDHQLSAILDKLCAAVPTVCNHSCSAPKSTMVKDPHTTDHYVFEVGDQWDVVQLFVTFNGPQFHASWEAQDASNLLSLIESIGDGEHACMCAIKEEVASVEPGATAAKHHIAEATAREGSTAEEAPLETSTHEALQIVVQAGAGIGKKTIKKASAQDDNNDELECRCTCGCGQRGALAAKARKTRNTWAHQGSMELKEYQEHMDIVFSLMRVMPLADSLSRTKLWTVWKQIDTQHHVLCNG